MSSIIIISWGILYNLFYFIFTRINGLFIIVGMKIIGVDQEFCPNPFLAFVSLSYGLISTGIH